MHKKSPGVAARKVDREIGDRAQSDRPWSRAGRCQLDQVVGLLGRQVALRHQLQPHRRRDHPLGEVGARESVAVVEELDHEIVAGVVVGLHGREV